MIIILRFRLRSYLNSVRSCVLVQAALLFAPLPTKNKQLSSFLSLLRLLQILMCKYDNYFLQSGRLDTKTSL